MSETYAPLDRILARERMAARREAAIDQRRGLLAKAYWRCLNEKRQYVREALRNNSGFWLEEFAPLAPSERMALIIQLRHVFGLPPDPRQRPAEGAPKCDAPDLARPE